jgi:hypothetical protein
MKKTIRKLAVEAGLPVVYPVCAAAIAFHFGIRCHIKTLVYKNKKKFKKKTVI